MSSPITITHGATFAPVLKFFQDETEIAVVNLTGATLTVVDSSFPVANTPAITVTDPVLGLAKFALTATQSAALTLSRTYKLRVKQVAANGDVTLHGPFVFHVQ